VAPAAEALPGEPGFAALETALADAADAERARLRETLAGARARGFLLDLSEFVACRGWLDPSDPDQTPRLARPLPETAAAALDRRLARAAKRAKGLDRLSTEQRHELRKELKKLRYSVEFCASLYPEKKVKPFLKRLKALQAVFGSLNDAAMAKELLGGPDAPGGDDPAAARAAGFVLGLHTERAQHGWTEAKALWTALRDTRPFWR
jgi:CHAD domain-containing protein